MYAIRLPAIDILEREINHLLTRPEGELPDNIPEARLCSARP